MKKLLLVSMFMFLAIIPSVFAASFTAQVQNAPYFMAGRAGIINLTVTNNGPTDWFTVSTVGYPSTWLVLDTTSGLIRVESGKSTTLAIFVNPGKDAIPLAYEYYVTVKSTTTNEEVEQKVPILVRQVTDVIIGDFKLSCEQCSKEVTASGTIYNVGTRDVPVHLSLKFGNDERTLDIPAMKTLTQDEFSETFDIQGMMPATYSIDGKITSGSKLLYDDTKNFDIPKIENVTFEEKSFVTPFGRFVSIIGTNGGNYKADAQFESAVSGAWYAIYTGPEAVKGATYKWTIPIESGATYELGYSEIYWPTYLIILIIIIIGIMIYRSYTAITLSKEIIGKNEVKYGHEMTVSIQLRNKIRDITNLVVKDVIPEGFALVTKFDTVKPTLRKVAEGTEIVWKIGDLKPHEQRVLHYKMKAVKPFRGRKHLEKASLVAKFGDKTVTRNSNFVTIYSEGHEPSSLAVEIDK